MNGYNSLRTLLLVSVIGAPAVSGCYTKVASDGDYWGYSGQKAHREVVVEQQEPSVVSDTVVYAASPAAAPNSVAANPTDKPDTVYVDDENRQRNDPGYAAGTTVINNYYGPDAYNHWYDYYPSRPGVTIAIGYGNPFYDPYPYSFYGTGCYPYDNWGHRRRFWAGGYCYDPYYGYPPAPFYSCLYDPYYDPFWNRPYWGGREYYGDWGGYGRGYGEDGRDGYAQSNDRNPNHKVGRIGGGDARNRSTAPIAQSGNGAKSGSTANSGSNRATTSSRASNPLNGSTASSNVAVTNNGSIAHSGSTAASSVPNTSNAASTNRTGTAPSANATTVNATTTASTQSRQVTAPAYVASTNTQSNVASSNVTQTMNANGHRTVFIRRNSSGGASGGASQPSRNSGRGQSSPTTQSQHDGGYTRSSSSTSERPQREAPSENSDGGSRGSSNSGSRSSDGGSRSSDGGSRGSSGGSSSGGSSSGGSSSGGSSSGGSRSSGGGGRAHSR
jgi:hypothetical protein